MEAFINTPSKIKIFANMHGEKAFPLSSKVSSAVPWRREICLSKSSYVSFPHCKGFHCLPLSNSEVGSVTETVNTEVLQTDGSNVACLRLQLEIECQYGECFLVVGNDPVLGSWNPSKAVPLSWSDGHIWTVDLELPIRKTIEYKFIWKVGTGDIIWQPGPNRIVRLGEGQNVVIVGEEWEDVDAQRILVKQENLSADTPNPKYGFNVSESANDACKRKICTSEERSSVKERGSNDTVANNKNRVDTEDEDKSLVIYDEGQVPIKDSSSNTNRDENRREEEGESLVNYDEGHVLVPGLTAQMITEEALAEELQKSILYLDDFLNGVGESMKNDEEFSQENN